jgi:hypothetical protein
MSLRRFFAFVLIALVPACAASERAASKDPMRCERDPKCAARHGKAHDCATQCSDNPACMDRCREMETDPGVGHR